MLEKNDIVISEEEKSEEEQGLAEVKADELKSKLAEDLGIDPDMEGDLLDKLVERETQNRERLSKTIKQKITWREKAKGSTEKPKVETPKDGKKPSEAPNVDELIEEALAKRDLKSLSLSEGIETEVKDLAKIKGISIGEAVQLPYIKDRIEAEKREQRILNATPGRNNKGGYRVSVDITKPLNHEDFDLSSEEGRKAWDDAKKARRAISEK